MSVEEHIQLNQVSVQVENGYNKIYLLKDINLTIAQGEWISIVGKNGSGKSTLAQLLTGILMPSSGTMLRGFSEQVPMPYVMQQEVQWFGETPWEDMIFLLESRGEEPQDIPEIIQLVLRSIGIEALKDRPFIEMSGGQKQLAAIAGCLAAKSTLIVFDEATSMLDSKSRLQVLEAAKKLNASGTTIVWITHHMEDLCYGQRVIALAGGGICYDNSTLSFFYQTVLPNLQQSLSSNTPCEELGFVLPYPVLIAHELINNGFELSAYPLSSKQLVEVVSDLGK